MCLHPVFFFDAPAECWCARTMVESIRMRSISVSPAVASTTRCQTPLRRHREKRMYTVCQRPDSAGRCHPWVPVRSIHSTASRKQQLSGAVRPWSPSLPGKIASTFFHASSLSSVRTMLSDSRKKQDVNTSQQMTDPSAAAATRYRTSVTACQKETLALSDSRELQGTWPAPSSLHPLPPPEARGIARSTG